LTERIRYYDSAYSSFADKVLGEIRRDSFGEDIGQNSWLLAEEYRRFFDLLRLNASSNVLEVASGSGGPTVFMAKTVGCHVTGIDVNANGIENANKMAQSQKLDSLATFLHADASEPLQFADGSFDAVICIDAINHLCSRLNLLREWHRVLKKGGRVLFTDPITVTGLISSEEVAIRSSIGYFLFAPPDEDERLVKASGFKLLSKEDSTEYVALVSKRMHDSRSKHQDDLVKMEGEQTFQGTQRFLSVAHTLASEKRLSRFMYLAQKEV
jgi:SAM-dependent methyltransferase